MEQTWEKLDALQHLSLLAEIHHQVTHVVTGFRLQGEAKGWGHCHAVDKETHKNTETHTGQKQASSIIQLDWKEAKTGDSNTAR